MPLGRRAFTCLPASMGRGRAVSAARPRVNTAASTITPTRLPADCWQRTPTLTQADTNSAAWHEGVRLLKRAIEERKDFGFETTLPNGPLRIGQTVFAKS